MVVNMGSDDYIKCDDDVQLALEYIRNNDLAEGISILKKYKGCNLTNLTCSYNGDDCVMQNLIDGFIGMSKK